MKNNRDHLLTKGYLTNKYEVQATFTSWDIVFTSEASHTHIQTHTPSPSHIPYSFSLRQRINQKVEWLSDSLPILDETLDTRVLNIMHCWPEMARSARLLQYWLIRTYKEGWSSNHISILQWSHIYQGLPSYLESSSSNYYWTWDIVLTWFSDCFLWGPQTTFDLHEKTIGIIYSTRAT